MSDDETGGVSAIVFGLTVAAGCLILFGLFVPTQPDSTPAGATQAVEPVPAAEEVPMRPVQVDTILHQGSGFSEVTVTRYYDPAFGIACYTIYPPAGAPSCVKADSGPAR